MIDEQMNTYVTQMKEVSMEMSIFFNAKVVKRYFTIQQFFVF